jgi:cobalt-zinc-cadmium efflux system outer membrane protein
MEKPMLLRRWVTVATALCLGGCLYPVRERTDDVLRELVERPLDVAPVSEPAAETMPAPQKASVSAPGQEARDVATTPLDLQTTGLLQEPAKVTDQKLGQLQERMNRARIPEAVPGSETPLLKLPKEAAEQQAAIRRLYPELPPLPEEPKALPGPNGQPYTLAALQQLAAVNSPVLRQAVSDVEAARGNLIQAGTYPNPTLGLQIQPSNDGSTPGVWGPSLEQVIKTGGKLKLQAAAAEIDLRNAELALRRARSDLATQVRNAYYGLIVAKETVRINKALAHFTDEVYLLQADLLRGGFAAPYEPATLRAQASTIRLAYQQSLSSYMYAWKQLVSVIGVRQPPLSEVAGRVDRLIPYFDYDVVLARVIRNHTDILTARNAVEKARYNLKLAQLIPACPDVDFQFAVLKEFVLPPMQVIPTASITVPLPIWDKNKGNIVAAEAALVRASEEPHRAEVALTNSLATAYAAYKNNVDGLEYYRRFILPDQVRAYRGVFERRRIDPGVAFADLVQAQQTLATDVANYLTILGQLWTSVVSVADLLQTDDLFQLAEPRELPPLPDLRWPVWSCPHERVEAPVCPGPHDAVQTAAVAPWGLPFQQVQAVPSEAVASPSGNSGWIRAPQAIARRQP